MAICITVNVRLEIVQGILKWSTVDCVATSGMVSGLWIAVDRAR